MLKDVAHNGQGSKKELIIENFSSPLVGLETGQAQTAKNGDLLLECCEVCVLHTYQSRLPS